MGDGNVGPTGGKRQEGLGSDSWLVERRPALYTYHLQCVHLYPENGEQVLKHRAMKRPRIVSTYAAPVFVLWIHSSHVTFSLPDERAAVRFKNTQILLAFRRARFRLFSIPGEHESTYTTTEP